MSAPHPLEELRLVVAELKKAGIGHCHWKSNFHLQHAVAGVEDFDLFVERHRFGEFAGVLLGRGFKLAESVTSQQQPGVFHFLGVDEATGVLIHIHAYTRILTGDHFLKSSAWPLERMLLGDTRELFGVPVPSAAAELIVCVLRGMAKHATLIDLLFLRWQGESEQEELAWILEDADLEQADRLLAEHLPELDPALFRKAVELLSRSENLMKRVRLARQFRRSLGHYQRHGSLQWSVRTTLSVASMLANRLVRRQKHLCFENGGVVVAFVGPPATGESMLIRRLEQWLGAKVAVRSLHAGKPPGSVGTFVLRSLIPLARMLAPGKLTSTLEERVDAAPPDTQVPLVILIRKVMLAQDRRRLLTAAYRASRNGTVVLCDRYPSEVRGAVDGPSFTDRQVEAETSRLRRWLMRRELDIYCSIPRPDLVVSLTVSVEATVARNRKEPLFPSVQTEVLSTDCELEELVRDLKQRLWARF